MALRNIVQVGDDVLRKQAKEVKVINDRILTLVEDMVDTLYESGGVGLAAPQVGVLRRIVVIDLGSEFEDELLKQDEDADSADVTTDTTVDAAADATTEESSNETPRDRRSQARALPTRNEWDLSVLDGEDDEEEEDSLIVLINPEIIYSEGETVAEEGCLSVPGKTGTVKRPYKVVVKALDIDGEEIEVTGEGFLAKAICHELDHLDGKLYIDIATDIHETEQ